jgi:hypothetical protein
MKQVPESRGGGSRSIARPDRHRLLHGALLLAATLWLGGSPPALAQISVGIAVPGVSIGINVPYYPEFVVVPGYPVYYAPQLDANLFFYDGLYWSYAQDRWYSSEWYNGPWDFVEPEFVPLFVLRVPVRYYRRAPMYFRGWAGGEPPRWGDHWGRDWQRHRAGWDRWDRRSAPRPAPLPSYQRGYSGNRYPQPDRQHTLRSENYSYQPREPFSRQHFETPPPPVGRARADRPPTDRREAPPMGADRQRDRPPVPPALPQRYPAEHPAQSRSPPTRPAPQQEWPQQQQRQQQERPQQQRQQQERQPQERPQQQRQERPQQQQERAPQQQRSQPQSRPGENAQKPSGRGDRKDESHRS